MLCTDYRFSVRFVMTYYGHSDSETSRRGEGEGRKCRGIGRRINISVASEFVQGRGRTLELRPMGELHVGSGLLTCRYQIESRESRGATAWQRAMSDRFELWLIVRAVSGPNKTRTSFLDRKSVV